MKEQVSLGTLGFLERYFVAVSLMGCAGTLTGRLLERWGMHHKERAIPGLCIGNGVGWVSPDLCMNVCVIDEVYSPSSAASSVASAQPCSAGRPVGIALLMCLPSASWIIPL